MKSPNDAYISIALCTYNGADYLVEQLESLLSQTYSNLEIIVVDDASTDSTASLLRRYCARDPRIQLYTNAVNLGFRENFARALSLCSGDFIAPCDQDDVWLPQKIEALHGAIGAHALVYCDSEIIDGRGESQRRSMSDLCNMISTHDPLDLAGANCVAGHAALFRRDVLDRALPIPECFYYDWWLAAVAAAFGGVTYYDRKLVRYRLHDRNVTNQLRERPAHRGRGRRALRLRAFGQRLERLAALPGPSRQLLQELSNRWHARENQLFSIGLSLLLFRYWRRIFGARKSRLRILPALSFAIGLRLKRVFNPSAYRIDDPMNR
jgi:glycosyltransferase involved in cell wall biosynthesis